MANDILAVARDKGARVSTRDRGRVHSAMGDISVRVTLVGDLAANIDGPDGMILTQIL